MACFYLEAIVNQFNPIVELLLKAGADTEVVELENKRRPIHEAARIGE